MPTNQTNTQLSQVLQQMMQTHPRRDGAQMEQSAVMECVLACVECAAVCTSCADACLGEQNIQMLVRCIGLNLDCAEVCAATGSVVMRQTEPNRTVIEAQLRACVAACRACGEECQRHAGHHEHCRVCADSCRRCEEACTQLLGAAV